MRVDLPGQDSRERNSWGFWHLPGWMLDGEVGGAARAKDELGREAQAGGSSACLSTVRQYHLQGWMTSKAAATAAPASGETRGWGVVLRCSQRTGC